MTGPVDPINLDSLIFESADGQRRLGRPNERDRELARQLVSDRGIWQLGGDTYLATIIAAVREGSTIEGRRRLVSATVNVSRSSLDHTSRTDRDRMIAAATRALWRRWSDELHAHALRPIGWPAVQRTHLAWSSEVGPIAPGLAGLPGMAEVDVDDPRWDVLSLTLACEAVPA